MHEQGWVVALVDQLQSHKQLHEQRWMALVEQLHVLWCKLLPCCCGVACA
jgi:hypothetical protein